MILDLEAGATYMIRHQRKGEFVATVLGVEPTKPGDPDKEFIRVEIDTSEQSPYMWMANSKIRIDGRKTTPLVTQKLLRPSLILGMERI